MSLSIPDHRALPVEPKGETILENERRYRAEVERSFTLMGDALRDVELRLVTLEETVINLEARIEILEP